MASPVAHAVHNPEEPHDDHRVIQFGDAGEVGVAVGHSQPVPPEHVWVQLMSES